MRQTGSSVWDRPRCSDQSPCTECEACKKANEQNPTIEDDQSITLYESSLGWFPFKE